MDSKRVTRISDPKNSKEDNVSRANETKASRSKKEGSEVLERRGGANEELKKTEETKEPAQTTHKPDFKPKETSSENDRTTLDYGQTRSQAEQTSSENDRTTSENAQPKSTTSDNNKGTNRTQGSKTPDKEPASSMNICNAVVILLVLSLIVVFAAIVFAPSEHEMNVGDTDFDFPKIFENKLMELQTSFTNQTDRFWRIVKNRGLAHLRNANPPQPLVLLLAAPPTAHGVVDCLARKLAEGLDPRNKRMLATIDGTEQKRFAGEKAKKKMDALLTDKFRAGHRVALIHHLELLPTPSPLLFYSYCHDRNAPHKHVAFIFTVHLPAEPDASLSPREAEGTAEKYLSSEVWAREDQEAVAALLSHVADTVALMNGEPDSVKASC